MISLSGLPRCYLLFQHKHTPYTRDNAYNQVVAHGRFVVHAGSSSHGAGRPTPGASCSRKSHGLDRHSLLDQSVPGVEKFSIHVCLPIPLVVGKERSSLMNTSKPPPSALHIILRLTTYQNAACLIGEYKNVSLNSSIYRVPDVPLHWDKLHSG